MKRLLSSSPLGVERWESGAHAEDDVRGDGIGVYSDDTCQVRTG